MICEPAIYYTLVYFHYIVFHVSSNPMLLRNSGTHTGILLCGTFPAEETRVNDMAQTISLLSFSYLLMTTKHYNLPKTMQTDAM